MYYFEIVLQTKGGIKNHLVLAKFVFLYTHALQASVLKALLLLLEQKLFYFYSGLHGGQCNEIPKLWQYK